MAEGKQHALAVGRLLMSTQEMYVFEQYKRTRHRYLSASSLLFSRPLSVRVCVCSRATNKGIGIENCHSLNDGLWKMATLD
jgi:predicted ribosome-associated RNA-binding protein Tma20